KAAQYTRSITTYFAPTLTCESSIELHVSTEVESMEIEPVELMKVDERTKMRLAIEELDRMLKKDDDKMDKGVRVRLQASLQYLWLRYQGQTRINASITIASSLGWGNYKARYIGAWAQNWIKWRKLPKENHGKFTKVSSLLDDERISMK
ncbi:220_t:CDS:2, partial [Gigaspora margarita]